MDTMASLVAQLLGGGRFAVEAYDGSRAGPLDAPATIVLRSPDAIWRMLAAPGELGLGRAYVAGDLDLRGDVFALLELRHDRDLKIGPRELAPLVRMAARSGIRYPKPPPEEVRLHGRRHSKDRDAAAIAAHYDVSNRFFELLLGPSLTYSCAVWDDPSVGLEAAQAAKHELICRKLDLQPGQRLLDVGCGWGSLLLHAAGHHGVRGVGVTISRAQAALASQRVRDAGLEGQVEIRVQDYRDVVDGPFDAISSVGMFEHVGLSMLQTYLGRLHELLRPGGRLLNHGISRPPSPRSRLARRGFLDRYVFPDGELHEVGTVASAIQGQGFEVRHLESLREHYALTLRAWSANLVEHWDEVVAEVGPGRAKVWRLYMAGAAVNFEDGNTQVHQVLAVRPDAGRSWFPLRPTWERERLSV